MRPILALLLGLPLLLGCNEVNVNADFKGTVKVGLVAPFSGRHYATGYNTLFAVRLALKEWNQGGGVGGYRIELVAQDDHNERGKGTLEAQKMVADPDVMGVIGHVGNSPVAAVEEYHRGGLAALFLGTASGDLPTKGYPGVLRLSPPSSRVAEAMAEFAVIDLQARRLAIITGPDADGALLARAVAAAASAGGATVLLEESLTPRDLDHTPTIDRITGASPDLILFSGAFAPGAAFLSQLRSSGVETAFLGGPLLDNPDFVRISGPSAQGAHYASFTPNPSQLVGGTRFVADYRTFSGAEPLGYAALAYDATNLLLEALQASIKVRGHPDRSAVVEALVEMGDFSGLTGKISFNSTGNIINPPIYIYELQYPGYPGQLKHVFHDTGMP